MRLALKERLVVDDKGKPTAVLIDIKQFKKILQYLEDIDDIRYIKKHMHEKRVPFNSFLAQLEGA